MKLTISAHNKEKQADFSYDLEFSGQRLVYASLAICGTILVATSLKYFSKRK